MLPQKSTITVVIPTVGRSELRTAVVSALQQTRKPNEILVLADTLKELDLPSDPRVRVIRVGPGSGGNVARQTGVEAASSDLIALLDDDDEWLANHLETLAALSLPGDSWIASSAVQARTASGRAKIWPARSKNENENLAQYLFRKHSVKGGVGFMQASSLLFPRSLAIAVPFNPEQKFHQDVGWLLDAEKSVAGLQIIQSALPTVIYNIRAVSVSRGIKAAASATWGLSQLDVRDRRTIGDFLIVHSLQGAKNSRSVSAMLGVMLKAFKYGRPGPSAVVYACCVVAVTAGKKVVSFVGSYLPNGAASSKSKVDV